MVANVLILPLSFISGIWFPLTGAPDWVSTSPGRSRWSGSPTPCTSRSTPSITARPSTGDDYLVLAIWLVVGVRFAIASVQRRTAR